MYCMHCSYDTCAFTHLPDNPPQLVLVELHVLLVSLRPGGLLRHRVHATRLAQGLPLHAWGAAGTAVGRVGQVRKDGPRGRGVGGGRRAGRRGGSGGSGGGSRCGGPSAQLSLGHSHRRREEIGQRRRRR